MYLLDANTYIQAKNLHYQMSFCPAYWNWLDLQFRAGTLGSITSVYDELANEKDELADWIKARKEQFYPISSQEIQNKMAEVAQHVVDLPNKNTGSVAEFLAGADPWLIAKASLDGDIIVTHEVTVDDQSKKIKIPNISNDFGVQCVNTFNLLKTLNARFILETRIEE